MVPKVTLWSSDEKCRPSPILGLTSLLFQVRVCVCVCVCVCVLAFAMHRASTRSDSLGSQHLSMLASIPSFSFLKNNKNEY